MTPECLSCGVENPETAQFCGNCGAPARDEEKARDEDRFKILVAVFIAIVSFLGAVLAWRISVAANGAADADVSGIVSTIGRNQARVASEADMYRNLGTYQIVRIHDLLSESLTVERERYPSSDSVRDQLWHQAWTENIVAEEYLDQVDIGPEYIRPDGSYDGQAAQDIDMAQRALAADFDPQGRNFSEADRLRGKAHQLMGLALVLTVALFFYTLAEVIEHASKYVCFALGSVVFVFVLVALPLIEYNLV
jgi:hypothetical protein